MASYDVLWIFRHPRHQLKQTAGLTEQVRHRPRQRANDYQSSAPLRCMWSADGGLLAEPVLEAVMANGGVDTLAQALAQFRDARLA